MESRPWHRCYEPQVPSSLDYVDITLPAIFERSAERYRDRPAIAFWNNCLNYTQLKDQIDRLATGMTELGVTKGERIAISLLNLPQAVIAYYAALKLGAQVVVTDPLNTAREISEQWAKAGVRFAVVLDFLFENRIRPMTDQLPVKHYIVASIPEYMRFPINWLAPLKLRRNQPPLIARVEPRPDIHFFRKLVRSSQANPPTVEVEMDDIAMLLFTGGTTGVPKAAMLTHRNMSVNVQQLAAWFRADPGRERLLTCLPLFHSYGITVSMLFPTYIGALMVLALNARDPSVLVQAIVKHKVTILPAVPTMYLGICQQAKKRRLDLSTIKACVSGSAPLSEDLLQEFEQLTGGRISEGFGLTETSPLTHANPIYGMRKVGSIGVPVPDTDAKIVDLETGKNELPSGHEGELIIKGPQVMQGYWNEPDETANMIRDGWLHTGDIATMDEDGYFYIVGRKKDMIISSGQNVFPDEVDQVLMGHPAVLESASIGRPDLKKGEIVKSFVVLRQERSATEAELITHCRQQLASYKIPSQIEFRDSLPKSTVLKVLRRQLREEEVAKQAQLRS